jgi:uncharacterized membrane protein
MFIGLIFSRWLHVISACLVIGALFFIRFLLPSALAPLEAEPRKIVFLRARRAFKMLVHSTIFLLLLTGSLNLWTNLNKYNLNPPLMHPILGTHILLALVAFAIALYVLAGKEPPASHRKLATINFLILLAAVVAASTLKWAREKTVAEHPDPVPVLENR